MITPCDNHSQGSLMRAVHENPVTLHSRRVLGAVLGCMSHLCSYLWHYLISLQPTSLLLHMFLWVKQQSCSHRSEHSHRGSWASANGLTQLHSDTMNQYSRSPCRQVTILQISVFSLGNEAMIHLLLLTIIFSAKILTSLTVKKVNYLGQILTSSNINTGWWKWAVKDTMRDSIISSLLPRLNSKKSNSYNVSLHNGTGKNK